MLNHGVLNLLKPPGMTSHDAVAHVRRVLHTKRVGHTGTLDPAASGVLLICVGQATRLVEALQGGSKEYLAEATFGYETDTLDAVGQKVRQCDASALTAEQLEVACEKLRGQIMQQPPLHSAIKIGGQKLYEIARAGGDAEIPSRSVTISALEITRFTCEPSTASSITSPRALLRVECSGGTYIRSLVRDIGQALESAATMTFLSRIQTGGFALSQSLTPQEFERAPHLVPLDVALENLYGNFRFDDKTTLDLWQGKRVPYAGVSGENDGTMLWSNSQKTLFAVARLDDQNHWKADKVFDLRD